MLDACLGVAVQGHESTSNDLGLSKNSNFCLFNSRSLTLDRAIHCNYLVDIADLEACTQWPSGAAQEGGALWGQTQMTERERRYNLRGVSKTFSHCFADTKTPTIPAITCPVT
ncbi:hypothetical protein TNIN_212921 [Trichonephila inaurata madagascariensis]|uniref:Uncharacterized protein n=1 Tax=Trichonephila inaurata madagascariensis TaxID=2747483 RepID=A0A8X7BSE3_9ARAC|nr:hypothetical protein TNIN_212921 [Trichonephila inaurata madagascariensis]